MNKTTINASDLKKAITEDGKTRKQLATEYGVSLAELDFILKTFNLNSLKAKRKGRAVKAKFDLNDDLKTAPVEISKKSSPAPLPELQQELAPQPDVILTTSSTFGGEGFLGTMSMGEVPVTSTVSEERPSSRRSVTAQELIDIVEDHNDADYEELELEEE